MMNTKPTPEIAQSTGQEPAEFMPVVLGGDIGGYSLARAFWEAYRVKSLLLSTFATGPVARSIFVKNHLVSQIDNREVLLSELNSIAAQHPDTPLLLLGSADWYVESLVMLRPRLAKNFVIPYPSAQVLQRATDKAEFSRCCQKLGIPHPQTYVQVLPGQIDHNELEKLGLPIIGKAGSTADFHLIDYPGKRKVYEFSSVAKAKTELETIAAAGYRGNFILQRKIAGNDAQMRILTCYCDKNSEVVGAVYGTVLLEEHTPGALGNPAGIISGVNDQLVEQTKGLLKELQWVGYANFDIKVDPVTGEPCVFELNPRLGRSNYYVTMTGFNPVVNYVREYIQGLKPVANNPTPTRLYTVIPLPLLLRYVSNRSQRALLRSLRRRKQVFNPLRSPDETNWRRRLYIFLNQLNQWRKFQKNYPVRVHRQGENHSD